MTGGYPPQESVVQFANIPAFVLTGWRMDCPTTWSLSGKLHLIGWRPPSDSSMAAQRQVDSCLCLLIVLQWFLVGAFPLVQRRRPWGEPGFLITFCTVVAFGLVVNPAMKWLAPLPALLACFAWLWLYILLVPKVLRAGWRVVMSRKVTTT